MRVGINGLLLSSGQNYRKTGVSRYIESLLAHLPEEAAGTDLIAYVDDSASGAGAGITWRRTPISVTRPPVRIAWELVALPVITRRDKLDIFHGTVNVVPFGLDCPSVVTIHDLAFLRYPEQVTARRYHYLKRMVGRSARRAAAVIVPSVATGEDVADLLGVSTDRIAVVPLGVSAQFKPSNLAEQARIREKHGLTKPFVLAVGTIEPRKNLPGLIQAMAILRSDLDEDLVIAGPTGWLTEEVERAIADSGIEDRIRRIGYIGDEELPSLYSAASVVAMPSLYEGFGLPVLEALATGGVVVTSNVSSLPEVAGDAAVLVDPTSLDAIAHGIRQAINDADLRTRLRAAAIERASQFTWVRTARETMSVYRSVAR